MRIIAIIMMTLCNGFAAMSAVAAQPITQLSAEQSVYLEHCGGCHGIQGVSTPSEIPTLRNQVGQFLCTPAGRAYLIRLPNVAMAPVDDDLLARMMNFVVFKFDPAAASHPPYTAKEVGALRKQPLTQVGLADYRAQIVQDVIKQCSASTALRDYDPSRPY